MLNTFLITYPQITQSLQIKANDMSIMLDTYLGIYCQVQKQLSIVSLKGIGMIGTQEKILEGYLIQNST